MSFWKNKKVLITGGAGFIGSNLAAELIHLGAKVKIIDNLERGKLEYIESIKDSIDIVIEDLKNIGAVKPHFQNIDVVFHLASKVGGIGFYLNSPGTVINENLKIDNNVLELVIKNEVLYYLYASSAHVYPKELQGSPDAPAISENQCYPANPELSYGWAKLIGEKQILYSLQENLLNAKVSIPRLIGAYGPNQDLDLEKGSAIPVFCRRAIEYPNLAPFTIWGTGKETRSFCYVKDMVDGLIFSLEKTDENLVGPFNLGAEGRVTIGEIAETIVNISGKEIDLKYDKTKETVIWGQAFDCSLSKRLLKGWEPKYSLKEGLAKTYEHIQNRLEGQ